MRKPDLTEEQRAAAARITAMLDEPGPGPAAGPAANPGPAASPASGSAANPGPAADPAHALPAVHAISRDRIVLGDVLGDYLHRVVVGTQADTVAYWPALELLRAAGADEERAAAKAAWLRQQHPPDVT